MSQSILFLLTAPAESFSSETNKQTNKNNMNKEVFHRASKIVNLGKAYKLYRMMQLPTGLSPLTTQHCCQILMEMLQVKIKFR